MRTGGRGGRKQKRHAEGKDTNGCCPYQEFRSLKENFCFSLPCLEKSIARRGDSIKQLKIPRERDIGFGLFVCLLVFSFTVNS